MMQIIPLDTKPNQSFQCTMNIDGVNMTLFFNIRYNEVAKCWHMTVSDPVTKRIYVDSVPLVPGDFPAGNLLHQHAYLGIGSAFLFNVTNASSDRPDDTNLGTDFILVWSDTI